MNEQKQKQASIAGPSRLIRLTEGKLDKAGEMWVAKVSAIIVGVLVALVLVTLFI